MRKFRGWWILFGFRRAGRSVCVAGGRMIGYLWFVARHRWNWPRNHPISTLCRAWWPCATDIYTYDPRSTRSSRPTYFICPRTKAARYSFPDTRRFVPPVRAFSFFFVPRAKESRRFESFRERFHAAIGIDDPRDTARKRAPPFMDSREKVFQGTNRFCLLSSLFYRRCERLWWRRDVLYVTRECIGIWTNNGTHISLKRGFRVMKILFSNHVDLLPLFETLQLQCFFFSSREKNEGQIVLQSDCILNFRIENYYK